MIAYALDPAFDGTYATDLTPLVLAAAWSLGMDRPYASSAAPLHGTLTLRGLTFSADPGTPLRITAGDITLLNAFVASVEPLPGAGESRLHLHGAELPLLLPTPPLWRQRQTTTADALIADILHAVPVHRRLLAGYLILGTPGYDRLGAKLVDLSWPQRLEPGRSDLLPATPINDTSAYAMIDRFAASERGRFYFARDGTAVFLNRHHTLTHLQAAATFSDTMTGVTLADGADVLHAAAVTIQPRSAGVPGSVLWSLAQPLHLPGGAIRTITAPYRDDDDQPCAAFDLLTPQPGPDFSAVDARSGADCTRSLRVRLLAAGEHAAQLEIRAASARPLRLLRLRLRGTPFLTADSITLEHTAAYSRTFYTGQRLHLDLPALVDLEDADRIARYELARRQAPRREATTLTLTDPPDLSLTLFDRITITTSASGSSGDYFIVAESHHIHRDTGQHTLTYRLEPADSDRFVIIGRSHPDGTRCLAY